MHPTSTPAGMTRVDGESDPMRKPFASIALAALLLSGTAAILPVAAAPAGSRVIVSLTLNSTLQFFDASSLEQTQPPLVSKGTSPVRLWVDTFGGETYLFSANHGVEGSVGVFDLDGALVTELPASPFPARAGTVGIVAGPAGPTAVPMVFATNTWQALGGCGLPKGSVTAYDASLLTTAGILVEAGTVDVSGAIPYAVALDEANGRAFVSTNCGNSIDSIDATGAGLASAEPISVANTQTRTSAAGPDATLFDQARGLLYTTNIGGNALSVNNGSAPGALTVVPLTGTGPIDATFAETPGGRALVITSNGKNDTVSLIDRAIIDACITASLASCPQAEVARIPTAVPGGAPEGVAYDAATNRIFVVNKGIGKPSLSVIQLTETGSSITGVDFRQLPLQSLGAGTPLPGIIAFDVVVQPAS